MKPRLPDGIVKRDGRKEGFDSSKIFKAIKSCLVNNLKTPDAVAEITSHGVTESVLNIIKCRKDNELGVEDVQRLVIQQLWSKGLFDVAEEYSLFREDRRKQREEIPIPVEYQAKIDEDKKHFPTPLQYYQFISKFSRWREDDHRRETWREACDRTMGWLKALPQVKGIITEQEWHEMDSALYNLEATCAMRVLQMAGPALDRCHMGVFNCSYLPISDLRAFAELLYILMQGTGAGFSVESEYVDKLPRIKKQKTGKHKSPKKFMIPDTTEGWCNALLEGLQTWFEGDDIEYDYSFVRPAGARLKVKGGRSSGPEPLRALLGFARGLVLKNQGSYLSDLDCHDLACMTGKIVQVGGVRRAACSSLSDLSSERMRNAKTGNWWEKASWRSMANNAACYNEPLEDTEFLAEWLSLSTSGSGERSIFNRYGILENLPKRRKRAKLGSNPCFEILLRAYQTCNLSISVARENDTKESLLRKVRIATFFGVIQSTCTSFNYVRPEWKKNAEEERLLGVDITGHADCPILRYGSPGRSELLRTLKTQVHQTKMDLAARFGINESTADTCVKPGGDSAALINCASGASPRFAEFIIRWVRERFDSPVTSFLKEIGVPCAEAPEDKSLVVFAFPMKFSKDCTFRNDMTAVQQLDNWLDWKQNWAEHSVSLTCYVGEDEWIEVLAWVKKNFKDVSGLSFLPRDNGSYRFAPNQEISEAEYVKMVADFPDINWAKLIRYEREDHTVSSQTFSCVGGSCEL